MTPQNGFPEFSAPPLVRRSWFFPAVFFVCLLISSAGCASVSPADQLLQDVADRSFDRIQHTGRLRVGCLRGMRSASVPGIARLQAAADANCWTILFFEMNRSELFPAVRNMTVDLIAGDFSEREILQAGLLPVLFSPDGTVFASALRASGLKRALENPARPEMRRKNRAERREIR